MSSLHAKDIFLDAIELSVVQRHAFIQQACAGNSNLLAKVAGFMATHEHASRFLSKPISVPIALACGDEPSRQHDERPGDVIERAAASLLDLERQLAASAPKSAAHPAASQVTGQ